MNSILSLVSLCMAAALSLAAEKPQLLSCKKIWDAAPHNAFTDLIRYQGEWLCAFREGKDHVSADGMLRIIRSADADSWHSWSLFQNVGVDLRDPKLSINPQGKLMVNLAGARRDRSPVLHESYALFTKDGKTYAGPTRIGDPNMWLWRVTWHKGVAYSVGYATEGDKFVRLYHSKDGNSFEILVPELFSDGYPNETALIFKSDGTAYCLLRRDGDRASGQLGRAQPPYREWTWKDLGVKIGGPQMIQLPDGRFIAGVRLYDGKVRTSLVQIDPEEGKLTELLALPSAGDSSYPGMVWHEGVLYVSYYSSHEGKTSIYLAKVKL
jgi:hypothetical protein